MFTKEDMMLVLSTTHPLIPSETLARIISFNWSIHEQVWYQDSTKFKQTILCMKRNVVCVMKWFTKPYHIAQVCVRGEWGKSGAPWEFNLRDTRRWCDLILTYPRVSPSYFIDSVYTSKFRCSHDREKVLYCYGP